MIEENPVCRCSLPMVRAMNDNYYICANCDVLQQVEVTIVGRHSSGVGYVLGIRETTRWDRSYERQLKKDIERWYGGSTIE